MTKFKAFTAGKGDGGWFRSVVEMEPDDLLPGEVLLRLEASSINYKDGLASIENGRVARISPLIPGVDAAGTVIESSVPDVAPGDRVLVLGHDFGVLLITGDSPGWRACRPAGWYRSPTVSQPGRR